MPLSSPTSSQSESVYTTDDYISTGAHNEQYFTNSSALFISAPKAGKSTLLAYIIEQEHVPQDSIPEVLPPSIFEIPVASPFDDNDHAFTQIILELTDTKSFQVDEKYTTEQQSNEIRQITRNHDCEVVVLVLDSSKSDAYNRGIILATLEVLRETENQLYIIQTKADLVEESSVAGDATNSTADTPNTSTASTPSTITPPHALVPQLNSYTYYRGSTTFNPKPHPSSHIESHFGKNTLNLPTPQESDLTQDELLGGELLKVIYQLTNVVMYSVKDLVTVEGEFHSSFGRALKRIHWLLQGEHKTGHLNSSQLKSLKDFIMNPAEEGGPEISQLTRTQLDQMIDECTSSEPDQQFTFGAFSKLIHKLIEMRELLIVWSFLHDAEYTADASGELELDDSVLFNVIPTFISSEYYLTLSQRGEAFLERVFKYFDHDNDGLLNVDTNLKEAFEFMKSSPFPKNLLGVCRLIENRETGEWYLPLDSWISLWYIVVLQNPLQVARCLHVWGFSAEEIRDHEEDESVFDLIRKPRHRQYPTGEDDKESCDVDTIKSFIVYIFGASRSGKSAFRYCMADKKFDPNFEIDYAYSTFSYEYDGKKCHVILRECDSQILNDQEAMSLCDAAVMIFDGSDRYSFSVLPSIHRKLHRSIPAIYIQTHAEANDVQQEYEETPKAFWEALGLPSTPSYFSATHHTEEEFQEIRETLLCLCHEPDLGQITLEDDEDDEASVNDSSLLEQLDEREIQRRENRKVVSRVLSWTLGLATLSGLGFLTYRLIQSQFGSKSVNKKQ